LLRSKGDECEEAKTTPVRISGYRKVKKKTKKKRWLGFYQTVCLGAKLIPD
jgi:hypothetical protein